MATFEEVGIRYLTAASVQAFREAPALWVLRYLFGKKDFRSPAFARSLALSDGMRQMLHHSNLGMGEDVALHSYVRMTDEWELNRDTDTGARNEHDNILPMFEVAVKALSANLGGLFRPNSSGLATHTFIGDLSTPFLSVPTFTFDQLQMHIKYTNRCPSKPKPKDLMAMAIDSLARPRLGCAILYVTAKKAAWYEPRPEELVEAVMGLGFDARALEVFLAAVESPEHALAMTPLNPDFYQWKPELLSEARQILFNSVEKVNGIICAKVRGRLPESKSWDTHVDLLSVDRPWDTEIEL